MPRGPQVKNFGRSGQTKYTHLLDQDTSTVRDPPWPDSSLLFWEGDTPDWPFDTRFMRVHGRPRSGLACGGAASAQRDAAWSQKSTVNMRTVQRQAGYAHANDFEKPTASKRNTGQ